METKGLNEYVNRTFRHLLAACYDGLTVIRANQRRAIKPNLGLFASVNATLVTETITDERVYLDKDPVDVYEVVSGREEYLVSINVYSSDTAIDEDHPQDILAAFRRYLSTEVANLALTKAAIGVTDIAPVRDLTALENADIEHRAQMDIFVNVATSTVTELPEIQTITITGTIETEGAQATVEKELDLTQ